MSIILILFKFKQYLLTVIIYDLEIQILLGHCIVSSLLQTYDVK